MKSVDNKVTSNIWLWVIIIWHSSWSYFVCSLALQYESKYITDAGRTRTRRHSPYCEPSMGTAQETESFPLALSWVVEAWRRSSLGCFFPASRWCSIRCNPYFRIHVQILGLSGGPTFASYSRMSQLHTAVQGQVWYWGFDAAYVQLKTTTTEATARELMLVSAL